MPKRILAADDSRTIRTALMYTFAKEPEMDLVTADNGQAVLEAIQREPFDLLLLDYNMPGMTGIELCLRLTQNPSTSHIPVVLLIGQKFNASLASQAGASGQIRKPFLTSDVIERVAEILQVSYQPAPQARPSGMGLLDNNDIAIEIDVPSEEISAQASPPPFPGHATPLSGPPAHAMPPSSLHSVPPATKQGPPPLPQQQPPQTLQRPAAATPLQSSPPPHQRPSSPTGVQPQLSSMQPPPLPTSPGVDFLGRPTPKQGTQAPIQAMPGQASAPASISQPIMPPGAMIANPSVSSDPDEDMLIDDLPYDEPAKANTSARETPSHPPAGGMFGQGHFKPPHAPPRTQPTPRPGRSGFRPPGPGDSPYSGSGSVPVPPSLQARSTATPQPGPQGLHHRSGGPPHSPQDEALEVLIGRQVKSTPPSSNDTGELLLPLEDDSKEFPMSSSLSPHGSATDNAEKPVALTAPDSVEIEFAQPEPVLLKSEESNPIEPEPDLPEFGSTEPGSIEPGLSEPDAMEFANVEPVDAAPATSEPEESTPTGLELQESVAINPLEAREPMPRVDHLDQTAVVPKIHRDSAQEDADAPTTPFPADVATQEGQDKSTVEEPSPQLSCPTDHIQLVLAEPLSLPSVAMLLQFTDVVQRKLQKTLKRKQAARVTVSCATLADQTILTLGGDDLYLRCLLPSLLECCGLPEDVQVEVAETLLTGVPQDQQGSLRKAMRKTHIAHHPYALALRHQTSELATTPVKQLLSSLDKDQQTLYTRSSENDLEEVLEAESRSVELTLPLWDLLVDHLSLMELHKLMEEEFLPLQEVVPLNLTQEAIFLAVVSYFEQRHQLPELAEAIKEIDPSFDAEPFESFSGL